MTKIEQRMAEVKLSASGLARASGVRVSQISIYKTGAAKPGIVNGTRIANALGATVSDLWPEGLRGQLAQDVRDYRRGGEQ